MARGSFGGAVCALALSVAFEAAAAEEAPLELAPSSDWVVDFADESCALRRNFGNGEQSVSLELRQFSHSNWIQAAVASRTLEVGARDPQFYFLPDHAEERRPNPPYYRAVNTNDGHKGIAVSSSLMPLATRLAAREEEDEGTFSWADADRDRRENEVTAYFVAGAFRQDVVLRTGRMHEPMKVMRTCLDDLLTQWGLDPEAHRARTREARLNGDGSFWRRLGRVMTASGNGGTARARVLVDEAGRATGCEVLDGVPAGRPAERFCEVVSEEDFEPALDRNSQPMKSYYLFDFAVVRRVAF